MQKMPVLFSLMKKNKKNIINWIFMCIIVIFQFPKTGVLSECSTSSNSLNKVKCARSA